MFPYLHFVHYLHLYQCRHNFFCRGNQSRFRHMLPHFEGDLRIKTTDRKRLLFANADYWVQCDLTTFLLFWHMSQRTVAVGRAWSFLLGNGTLFCSQCLWSCRTVLLDFLVDGEIASITLFVPSTPIAPQLLFVIFESQPKFPQFPIYDLLQVHPKKENS